MTTPGLRLTGAEREEFESAGVLVVRDLLPGSLRDAVVAEYGRALDALCAGWVAEGRLAADDPGTDFFGRLTQAYEAGCDWFQPLDISLPGSKIEADTPLHLGPAVFDMMTAPAILDMVEDLIGPEITLNPIQHVRLKPPARRLRAGEETVHMMQTAWHQDRAVAHAEADATAMVTVWLAITDATLENGCLTVLPGKPGMYPHCPKDQTQIADGLIAPDAARPVPVPAGGAVVFHPLTPHASLDNRSDGFRWSFDLRYSVTGQPTGRAHFPQFVVRSRRAPDSVVTDWRVWRDAWLDARARLAPQPHIPIHRWSADSPACA